MLHKYNYLPIEQPTGANEVVRFVENQSPRCSPTPAQAEDAADRVEIDIAELPAVRDTRRIGAGRAGRASGV
jgi:hypothetical protein